MTVNEPLNFTAMTNQWLGLTAPYPEPAVLTANSYYAKILLESYSGKISEMTIIHQYNYHLLTLFSNYAEVVQVVQGIASMELQHMTLLGQTIRLLGIQPKFRTLSTNLPVYWHPQYVYFGKSIWDGLAADISAEKSAILQYRQQKQLIDDPNIQKLLDRIILDEKYHLHLLQKIADKYCPALFK